MMIEVYNLEEIPSSIPPSEENPRRFHMNKDPMFVNLDRADVARTFKGIIVLDDDGPITPLEVKENLVEIFWSGITIVTIFNSRIERFLCPDEDDDMPSKNPNWKNPKLKDDGRELPFNERKSLPSKDNDNKKETEKWN